MIRMEWLATTDRDLDRNGLEILDRDECLRLLATALIGRVGISSGALPVIFPVNFRVVDETILFKTSRGTKLDAATHGAVVAFEADTLDPFDHTGWSVLVTGVARPVTDPDELLAIRPDTSPRWAPSGDECVVAITTEIVTGRRLR